MYLQTLICPRCQASVMPGGFENVVTCAHCGTHISVTHSEASYRKAKLNKQLEVAREDQETVAHRLKKAEKKLEHVRKQLLHKYGIRPHVSKKPVEWDIKMPVIIVALVVILGFSSVMFRMMLPIPFILFAGAVVVMIIKSSQFKSSKQQKAEAVEKPYLDEVMQLRTQAAQLKEHIRSLEYQIRIEP